jgi:AraC-like DNA-binding protein
MREAVYDGVQQQIGPGCRIGRIRIVQVGAASLRHLNRGRDGDADMPESYDIILPCDGSIDFCQNGMSGEVRRDEYVVLSRHSFYELSSGTSLRHWRVTVPAADLRTRFLLIEDHIGRRFDQNRHMAGLMLGMVDMVARTFTEECPPNPEALATEIIAFIVLVLGSEVSNHNECAHTSRYRLRQRIYDFIDQNLADAELSPKQIATANRISLSYLYSLFSDNDTTVAQFIQAKRLQRAYELLVADPKRSLTVSEIAYLVGFKNVSHFSRKFSNHFRIAPRDARLTGLQMRRASGRNKSFNADSILAPA